MEQAGAHHRLKKHERHEQILLQLKLRPHVRVAELATLFGVTTETVRRDMGDLERRGLLERPRGEGYLIGMIAAATLGIAFTETADTGMITARRWAACFEQLRGFVRLDVLFEALQSLFAEHQGPTDLRPLLGPFLEIAVEGGGKLRDPRARQSLQDFSGGKAGGQARRLLAL